ncbi:MAG: hypothetical protein WCE52_08380 [Candidatus Acidiferrum sp.]
MKIARRFAGQTSDWAVARWQKGFITQTSRDGADILTSRTPFGMAGYGLGGGGFEVIG